MVPNRVGDGGGEEAGPQGGVLAEVDGVVDVGTDVCRRGRVHAAGAEPKVMEVEAV